MVERVQTSVTIVGKFNEAERKRLTQIVSRCPVHKTLVNGLEIFDSVSFDAGG